MGRVEGCPSGMESYFPAIKVSENTTKFICAYDQLRMLTCSLTKCMVEL
jgi:hypothetical protein